MSASIEVIESEHPRRPGLARRQPRTNRIDRATPEASPQVEPSNVFRMRNTGWDHDRFADRVRAAARADGLTTAADISRATNGVINPGQLSKWFRGVERPAVDSLRVISRTWHIPLSELLVLAGHSDKAELDMDDLPAAPRVLHPLAEKVDRLLGADSPLPDGDRDVVEKLIESVVSRYEPRRRRTG